MSSCIAMFTKNVLYMCGDSALCYRHKDNNIYRVSEDANKISFIEDKIIFTSGMLVLTEEVIKYFKVSKDKSVEALQNIMKDVFDMYRNQYKDIEDYRLGALIGTWENDMVVVYGIDSNNNFEIEKNISDEENTLFAVAEGVKKTEVIERAGYYYNKFHIGYSNYSGTMLDVYKNTYNDICCEEIGGLLTVWGLQDGKFIKVMDYNIKEKDNLRRIDEIGEYIGNNKIKLKNCSNIKDSEGRVRAVLGNYDPEGANGKYGLLLKDREGDKTILDENGILQTYGFVMPDSLDSSNPMVIPFFVPSGVSEVRTCKVYLMLDNFRAYSKASKSGGGFTNTYTSEVKDWRATDGTGWKTPTRQIPGDFGTISLDGSMLWTPCHKENNSNPDDGYFIDMYDLNHRHSIKVEIEPHPHDLEFGIYKGTKPSNVGVKINGTSVASGISSNTFELDIAQYIKSGQWNTVEISSNTMGRIIASFYFETFVTT